MAGLAEHQFHLVMGGLFVVSVATDALLPRALPQWNPPDVGFLTFVVGLCWVGRYAAWRAQLQVDRARVLEDRIARLERASTRLEDAVREHLRRPL
ncbi:MAG TPA: hypothetical protein VK022_03305 [Paracoccaceae bacterium]|nr:hypothetical protein [Paracoccaceae bacterium]